MGSPLATPRAERARNAFGGTHALGFRLCVWAVSLSGVALLLLAAASLDVGQMLSLEPAFWALCALLLAAEVRPLFTAGARDSNGLSVSTAFVFALMLRYGLPVAILVQALAVVISDVSRGKAPWRTAFNVGQFTVSWAAASVVMQRSGLDADLGTPTDLAASDLLGVC